MASLVGPVFRDDADGRAGGAAVAGDDDDLLVLDLDDDDLLVERTDELLPLPLLPMLRDEDAWIPAEEDDGRLPLLLLLLVVLLMLVPTDDEAVALWRTYDAVAILPLGSTLAERVRLELRRRVPLALRAAALCVAEVGVDEEPGEDCFMADRPRLLVLVLLPMAPFLSLRSRGDLPPTTRLLVRILPPDGSGSGGGGASFSPSERYMAATCAFDESILVFGFHVALFGIEIIAFGMASIANKNKCHGACRPEKKKKRFLARNKHKVMRPRAFCAYQSLALGN